MRFLFKALLAATALIPVATAASAQDSPREGRQWRGDGQGRGDRGGDRASRQALQQPQRLDVDRDMARRGDWNANRDGAPVAAPRTDDGERRDWNRTGGQGRPDRDRADAPAQPRTDANAGWRGDDRFGSDRRADRGDRPLNRDLIQGGDYGRSRDGDAQRGNDWNRRGDANQWRGADRLGGQLSDRGAWNRTWRGDRRYDWSGYRNSNRGAYRLPRYYAPRGWGYGYRRFSVGVTLNAILFDRSYWIEDPYSYRLPDAYGPYRWVRYYNDALLVDLRNGRVVDVVNGIFW